MIAGLNLTTGANIRVLHPRTSKGRRERSHGNSGTYPGCKCFAHESRQRAYLRTNRHVCRVFQIVLRCEDSTLNALRKEPAWFVNISLGVIAATGVSFLIRTLYVSRRSARSARLGLTSNPEVVREGELETDVTAARDVKQSDGMDKRQRVKASGLSTDEYPISARKPLRAWRAFDLVSVISTALALAAVCLTAGTRAHLRSQSDLINTLRASASVERDPVETTQRPWVGSPAPKAFLLSGQTGSLVIQVQNFGKTPAFNVRIKDCVLIENLDDLTGMPELGTSHPLEAGTLMPDQKFETDVSFKASPEGLAILARGKVRAVNYASITYEDAWHHPHVTRSCSYWYGGMRVPLLCEQFNSAD